MYRLQTILVNKFVFKFWKKISCHFFATPIIDERNTRYSQISRLHFATVSDM